MKTAIKTLLTCKVHYLLFVLVCLMLATTGLTATLMADDLSSIADGMLHDISIPFHCS